MTLYAYQQQVQRLIRDIAQKDANPADLIGYINEARTQLAGDSQSIRAMGALALTAGSMGPYAFSSVSLTSAVGVAGILSIQTMWYWVGGGQQWIRPRSFPAFSLFTLNDPVPEAGQPIVWSQYGQGVNGTLYFNMPDIAYQMVADCTCYPAALASDTDPEAIPAPWTTAGPYYAAYLALMAMSASDQSQAADMMFKRYTMFVTRARVQSTPMVSPSSYAQVPSLVRDGQLGQSGQQGGGA